MNHTKTVRRDNERNLKMIMKKTQHGLLQGKNNNKDLRNKSLAFQLKLENRVFTSIFQYVKSNHGLIPGIWSKTQNVRKKIRDKSPYGH